MNLSTFQPRNFLSVTPIRPKIVTYVELLNFWTDSYNNVAFRVQFPTVGMSTDDPIVARDGLFLASPCSSLQSRIVICTPASIRCCASRRNSCPSHFSVMLNLLQRGENRRIYRKLYVAATFLQIISPTCSWQLACLRSVPDCRGVNAASKHRRYRPRIRGSLLYRSRDRQYPGCIPTGRGRPKAYGTDMAYSRSSVKNFSRKCDILDAVEAALSHERLSTYRDAVANDRKRALQLHAWNTTIGAALYEPLQGLEITLRNAIDAQLTFAFDRAWYDNMNDILDKATLDQVANAKRKLKRAGLDVDAPEIAANLPFGFWVSLTGRGGKSNYEAKLWRPALRRAFPHKERLLRKEANESLNRLRDLRNRIAHHEPIFMRNLKEDYQEILELVSWICPVTADLIDQHSRVLKLLPSRDVLMKTKF